MYLYDGRLSAEELADTPITLYAPMSFDPSEVPFVRGFLEYEQRISLDESVDHQYTVVDTTQSPWHNAESAASLAEDFGTDSVASIQLDIRKQTYLLYEEVCMSFEGAKNGSGGRQSPCWFCVVCGTCVCL